MKFPHQVIRDCVPIVVAARHFNVQLKPEPDAKGIYRTNCPRCEEKGGHSLTITPQMGWFTCWKVRKPNGDPLRGDVIGLTAHLKTDGDLDEARAYLVKVFNISNPEKEAAEPTEEKPMKAYRTTPLQAEEPHARSKADASTTAKGFPLAVCKATGIKFAKPLPDNYLVVEWKKPVSVPIRDEKGKLLGSIIISEALLPPTWEGL